MQAPTLTLTATISGRCCGLLPFCWGASLSFWCSTEREDGASARRGLIRGYLLLVLVGWLVQPGVQSPLPLTDRLDSGHGVGLWFGPGVPAAVRSASSSGSTGEWPLGPTSGTRRGKSFYNEDAVNVIGEAAGRMSQSRRGALILSWISAATCKMMTLLPPAFRWTPFFPSSCCSTFFPSTPHIHDGAVLVRGEADCFRRGDPAPGRGKGPAASAPATWPRVGITERFDQCLCVVVSEETGTISLAHQLGHLERPITSSRLKELLGTAMKNVGRDPGESAFSPALAQSFLNATPPQPTPGTPSR